MNIGGFKFKIRLLQGQTRQQIQRQQQLHQQKIQHTKYKYPYLFHKYLLGISTPNKPITYKLIQHTPYNKTFNNNKLFAHLHCYDISKFNEIYGEYIEKICSFFKVVITFSIGESNINNKRYVIIKIPNKGMDIGAKYCMVQYLNDCNISYEYILFLHSKSNIETRYKYFTPLIENINKGFIDNINNYDGYFPDIQWEIQGNKLKMITGNPQFANSNLPEINLENRNDLLGYIGCENRTNRFVEGNVYILSKKIVDILFVDKKLYNILNGPYDFDYNWVRKRYGLSGGVNNIYNYFKTNNLPPKDKLSYDGYIEHAFERVVLNLIKSHKYILLKQPPKLFNILIRNTYRPSYFPKCINSILNQTYQNFKIIMCYDDDHCLEYLDKYKGNPKIEIFKAKPVDKTKRAFYNLYCNQLLEKVKEGWVMFLDDDDVLANKTTLEKINTNLNYDNDILFWKVKIGNNIVYPKNINNIQKYSISSIGFCFNSKFKNFGSWNSERCSDYKYVTELLQNKKDFKRKFLDNILTEVQHGRIMGLLGKKEIPQSIKTINQLIEYLNIKNIYTSKSLAHFNKRICKKFNLTNKRDNVNPMIFFGLYTPEDLNLLLSLTNSNICLVFGGSDVPNIQHLIPIIGRINIIAISPDIQNRLKKMNIPCKLIDFNLVDTQLFYPRSQTGDYIYIYDGFTKDNPNNKIIYGKKYYDEIIKRLPGEKFIFSSQLNAKYEDMPDIYAKCKIGLRLTNNDGNANTVQEFKAMNIPIVHNQSIYGLKWTNIDDIIKHISLSGIL